MQPGQQRVLFLGNCIIVDLDSGLESSITARFSHGRAQLAALCHLPQPAGMHQEFIIIIWMTSMVITHLWMIFTPC